MDINVEVVVKRKILLCMAFIFHIKYIKVSYKPYLLPNFPTILSKQLRRINLKRKDLLHDSGNTVCYSGEGRTMGEMVEGCTFKEALISISVSNANQFIDALSWTQVVSHLQSVVDFLPDVNRYLFMSLLCTTLGKMDFLMQKNQRLYQLA